MNGAEEKISAPKARLLAVLQARTESLKNGGEKNGPQFDVPEKNLAGIVGLTPRLLRSLRSEQLREGVHWRLEQGRVCYGAEGVARVQELLDLTRSLETGAAPPAKANAAGGPNKAPVTLKVFRIFGANPKILEAHLPERDPAIVKNRVRVRVKNSANFTKGMEIPVTELSAGLYELARACPRSRGRW